MQVIAFLLNILHFTLVLFIYGIHISYKLLF